MDYWELKPERQKRQGPNLKRLLEANAETFLMETLLVLPARQCAGLLDGYRQRTRQVGIGRIRR